MKRIGCGGKPTHTRRLAGWKLGFDVGFDG